MNNKDLKKLALMGILSGIVVASQSQLEAQNSVKNPPRNPNSETNTQDDDNTDQNKGNIAQGYSNQGYYYNQDQGRSSNYYYYQQNPKRNSRTRPNQPSDNYQNQDQVPDEYNRRSPQRYQDLDINRYNRDKVADSADESNSNTKFSPEETPPDNIQERPTTEGKFLSKLSPQGTAKYQSLSLKGKMLARNMAAHDCAGKNDCKGQNACKTDKNECAGKGSCKGHSSCKVTPDEAVKLATMLDKRNNLK